jgi:uncharacterized protein YndB with AHSA1/START domain
MTEPTPAQPAEASPGDAVIERIFDAPIELVWSMWTDPEHFKAWYGPTGATIPSAEMDVTVGGRRLVCMEMPTPDGPMQMWFAGRYTEITAPTRLVYTDAMADEDGTIKTPESMGMPPGHPSETEVIVELEDLGDKTKMVMTHVGVPADSPGAGGWAMAFDKLVAHLSSQS